MHPPNSRLVGDPCESALRASFSFGVLILSTSAVAELTDEQIAQLYAKPSPFGKSLRDRWIGESENAFAVRDINPQSPIHLLVVSKKRYPTMLQAPDSLLGEFFAEIRPASTFVEVKGFIDREWLVEVEADCVADTDA